MSLPGEVTLSSHGVEPAVALGMTPLAPRAFKESHVKSIPPNESEKGSDAQSPYGGDEKGSVAASEHQGGLYETDFVNGEPVIESGMCHAFARIRGNWRNRSFIHQQAKMFPTT